MNQYGAQAQRHWREYLPSRYATLPDPNSYFSTLGEQAAQQIEELTRELAGPDQPGEGFLDRLGRLNNAKMRAEEIVLPELVLIAPETETEVDGETSPLPADEWTPLTEQPHPAWQEIADQEAAMTEQDGPPGR